MDVILFLKIIVWAAAVASTALAIFSGLGLIYYKHTQEGKIETMRLALRGFKPTFRWNALLISFVAWAAIISFH